MYVKRKMIKKTKKTKTVCDFKSWEKHSAMDELIMNVINGHI